MLVIRQEQMDALIKGSDQEWVDFLTEHVKGDNPTLKDRYTDDQIRQMVRSGIARSESHGITSAEEQSAFVSIMFKIAPNFDDQPEIKSVLDDDRFLPPQRIENLWSPAVPDETWDKAKAAYDESAWNLDKERLESNK